MLTGKAKHGSTGTPGAVCRMGGKCALKAARFWDFAMGRIFLARLLGDFAPCEARPETLSLDSATFEKVDETFICVSSDL